MPYTNVPKNQWAKMDRCVSRVQRRGKGMDKGRAIAICHSSVVGKKDQTELDFELMTDEEIDGLIAEYQGDEKEKEKEKENKNKGHVPIGITTFSDLKAYREAQERADEVVSAADDLIGLTMSVIHDPAVPKKGQAIVSLAREFASIVDEEMNVAEAMDTETVGGESESEDEQAYPTLMDTMHTMEKEKEQDQKQTLVDYVWGKIKGLLGIEKPEQNQNDGFMIWKEAETGQYQWLARYSNNLRDDDDPPEIISEASHRKFVDMVDKGLAPMPELWIWHVPEWKVGNATALAYDDSGFAIAIGYFDKGKEHVAEWLSKQNDVLVSHGMPPWFIKRDENDPSIIIEHQTAEISPLPGWAAANKITGFAVLDTTKPFSKEIDMIPEHKRKTLIEQWKIDPAVLGDLEAQNRSDAEKAASQGRESKEKQEELVETVVKSEITDEQAVETTETTETEQAEQTESASISTVTQADYPTREEIADAFGVVLSEMKGQIETLSNAVLELTKEMKVIKESDEAKIASAVQDVPAASLSALLSRSIVGQRDAAIDGRSTLMKDKPKEATANLEGRYGIPFLDRLVNGQQD